MEVALFEILLNETDHTGITHDKREIKCLYSNYLNISLMILSPLNLGFGSYEAGETFVFDDNNYEECYS